MSDSTPERALATIERINKLLQAAYVAARELEELLPPKPLDRLSDHIQSVSAATECIREDVEARVLGSRYARASATTRSISAASATASLLK